MNQLQTKEMALIKSPKADGKDHIFTAIISDNDVMIRAKRLGKRKGTNGWIPLEQAEKYGITESTRRFWIRLMLGDKEILTKLYSRGFARGVGESIAPFMQDFGDNNFYYGKFDSDDFSVLISFDKVNFSVIDTSKAIHDNRYSFNHEIDLVIARTKRSANTMQLKMRATKYIEELKKKKYKGLR